MYVHIMSSIIDGNGVWISSLAHAAWYILCYSTSWPSFMTSAYTFNMSEITKSPLSRKLDLNPMCGLNSSVPFSPLLIMIYSYQFISEMKFRVHIWNSIGIISYAMLVCVIPPNATYGAGSSGHHTCSKDRSQSPPPCFRSHRVRAAMLNKWKFVHPPRNRYVHGPLMDHSEINSLL